MPRTRDNPLETSAVPAGAFSHRPWLGRCQEPFECYELMFPSTFLVGLNCTKRWFSLNCEFFRITELAASGREAVPEASRNRPLSFYVRAENKVALSGQAPLLLIFFSRENAMLKSSFPRTPRVELTRRISVVSAYRASCLLPAWISVTRVSDSSSLHR